MGKTALEKQEEAGKRNLENNRSLLTKLREIVGTSGVPGAEEILSVELETDSMFDASPFFEVLCRGKIYSNFLSFDEAESTLLNIVTGMRLVSKKETEATV